MRIKLIVLLLSLFSGHLSFADLDVETLIEYNTSSPILRYEDVPGLYDIFLKPVEKNQSLLQLMSKAQNELIDNKSNAIVSELVIVESKEVIIMNAVDNSGPAIHSRIVISTGAFEFYFNHNYRNKDSIRKEDFLHGVQQLCATIAHEMAHVFDYTNRDAIKVKSPNEQMVEIKVDLQATEILRKVKLDPSSSYDALLKIKKDRREFPAAMDAYIETHPMDDVRLNALATQLTSERIERGYNAKLDLTPIYKHLPQAKLDLAKRRQNQIDNFFLLPKEIASYSYQELHKEIEKQNKSIDENSYLQKIQKNYLATMFIQKLKNANDFDGILKLLRSDIRTYFLDQGELEVLRGKFGASQDHPAFKSIQQILREDPFFNSKEYLQKIRRSFDNGTTSDIHLLTLIPIDKLFTFFKTNPRSFFIRKSETSEQLADIFIYDSKDMFSNEKRIWLASKYASEAAADMNLSSNILLRLIPSLSIDLSFELAEEKSSKSNFRGEILALKKRIKNGDKDAQVIFDNYKKFLNFVVKNSAALALREVTEPGYKIHWDLIAQVLQLDKKQLYKTINKNFIELIKDEDKVRQVLKVNKYNEDSALAKTNLLWFDSQTNYALLIKQLINKLTKLSAKSFIPLLSDPSSLPATEKHFDKQFSKEVTTIKPDVKIDIDKILLTHRNTTAKVFNSDSVDTDWHSNPRMLHLKSLDSTSLTNEQKADWIRLLFFTSHKYDELKYKLGFKENWTEGLLSLSEADLELLLKQSIKYGIFKSNFNFIIHLKNHLKTDYSYDAKVKNNKIYHKVLRSLYFIPNFKWELNVSATIQGQIKDLLEILESPNQVKRLDSETLSSSLSQLKKQIVDLILKTNLEIEAIKSIFSKLTETGPTTETDIIFKTYLEEKFSIKNLEEILNEKRIFNTTTQVALARQVLNVNLNDLSQNLPVSDSQILELVKKLHRMAPGTSFAKDQFLEEIAWKLQLEGRTLQAFIEENKSAAKRNITNQNPHLPRIASFLTALLDHTSIQARWGLIDFIRNPSHSTSLNKFLSELNKLPASLLTTNETVGNIVSLMGLDRGMDFLEVKRKLLDSFTSEVEKIAISGDAITKTPIINLILTSGRNALSKQSDFFDVQASQRLDITNKLKQKTALQAFLQVVPSYEKTVILSYLLANQQAGEFNATEIFKMGRAVGVKFGQLSGIWNLFGEEVSLQLKSLKDNAGALSKAEIEELFNNKKATWPILKNAKLIKVLGSASIKTAVLIELNDGRKAVLYLKNPRAEAQIATNMKLSKKFVAALEKTGIFRDTPLYNFLLDGMAEQIFREIDFNVETDNLMIFKKLLPHLNKSARLGWSFDTVVPFSDDTKGSDMALVTLASGSKFEELSNQQRKEAGFNIVHSQLDLFFKFGFFEPDRHVGNFIFDGERKKIIIIDPGQLESYSKSLILNGDDRTTVVELILSMINKDADAFIKAAQKMSESHDASQLTQLKSHLHKILSNDQMPMDIKIQELFKELAISKFKLKTKFSFGFIKGFMILYGEKYVSGPEFNQILKEKVISYGLKRPTMYLSLIKTWFNHRSSQNNTVPTTQNPRARNPTLRIMCKQIFAK